MKFSVIYSLAIACATACGDAVKVIPAEPTLEQFAAKARNADIVLFIQLDKTVVPPRRVISEVLQGKDLASDNKETISAITSGFTDDGRARHKYPEVVFIRLSTDPNVSHRSSSWPLLPTRTEKLGPQVFKFLGHSLDDVRVAIVGAIIEAQAGADKPATRSESKPEGGDKPQPAAEGRSR